MNSFFIRALSAITQANIELEAMKAANVEREIRGNSPAYGEEAFLTLQQNLHNQTIELIQNIP